ncbi:MAG: glycosyltransferase [Sphingobacteriales bacterium]|nr:glycosyltransferase [Sphingobacteriales bacterium]
MESRNILWLPGWYPSALNPFNGDFIKRHAEAMSLFENVTVIYAVRDERGIITRSIHKEEKQSGRLTEIIIYYYITPLKVKIIEKFFSFVKFRSIYKSVIGSFLNETGNPDLVHVHMGMRVASLATWLNRKTGAPLVVTEHWSGFLAQAEKKFTDLPVYLKNPWKKLIRNAAGISVVSKFLAKGLSDLFPQLGPEIIPNVVNEKIFNPIPERKNNNPVFLHVSGLDDLKNPILILKAFRKTRLHHSGAKLIVIGSQRKEITDASVQMGIGDAVQFLPEIPQDQLADFMRLCDALILYSRYETFGCVIIEANACGIPVIVSDIPVFHETVKEGENGIFAGTENPDLLAEKMKWVIENKKHFNSMLMADKTISKYGYATVGRQFSDWYNKILVNHP